MAATVKTSEDLRAGRPVRSARISLGLLALAAAAAPLQAVAQPIGSAAQIEQPAGGQSIADFYAARDDRPLWLEQDGSAGRAASILLDYLSTAQADGLEPDQFRIAELSEAVRLAASGTASDVSRVDRMLSKAFVAYVRDLKQVPSDGLIWVDPELKPRAPTPRRLLEAAASAPSLEAWLTDMAWMHPIYAGLRRALVEGGAGDRQLLRLNLERARALPSGRGRHVIVNATSAQLSAYEDGRVVDTMRVIVGKPRHPTPMMAALIRYASLNPYWYVPPDLAAERIAPNVIKDGPGYLSAQGYQILSDWSPGAQSVDPATIDWQSVAGGSTQVWMRQLPGPANAMGDMKFMFPNSQGVYLHDTPQKELLAEASRMFSGGCVRLEDAPRLARWLFGRPLQAESSQPELRVDLPEAVPVYITYLTMVPSGSELATYPDVYGRDRQQLASLATHPIAAR
jgi:murein L,D-transpeptidase YcbB/YkuD